MQQRTQMESIGGPSWAVRMTEVASAVEMVGQVGNAVAGDAEMAGVDSFGSAGGNLLGAVWKFSDAGHWLTTRNPLTGAFQSMLVGSLNEALKRAVQLAQSGFDVYLSPAEFASGARSRKALDVVCVRGFWLDIDVGPAKAEQGQGYLTLQVAMAAVKVFRIAAGLPRPTHVVCSGGGLHVYWVVDAPMDPTQWQASAKMLKALTKSLGLLADPTRTADIASLMRVPDTYNFKDKANPRAVKLIYSSVALIEKSVMINAIEAAHIIHCGAVKPQTPALLKMQVSPGSVAGVLPKQWPVVVNCKMRRLLKAILERLDPDCGYDDWFRIAAAVFHETGGSEDGFCLFNSWSSTSDKYRGVQETRSKWRSFKPGHPTPVRIATLRRMLEANGHEWFEVCAAAEDGFETINGNDDGVA